MATRRTYLDNASTTFPKPPCVTEAVCRYMTEMGTNVGRGEYASALTPRTWSLTREPPSVRFSAAPTPQTWSSLATSPRP